MSTLTFSTRKSATWCYYPALGPHQSDVFFKSLVCWTTVAKATLSNPKLLTKECLMVLHVDQMGFLLYCCENPLMAPN